MDMIRIALAGNPNSGKTTLFNGLTGSNQFVGNWPGVTVEKKEGKLKKHDNVTVTDLPGIYSLSPYTLEEVVARNYLTKEEPDAILNIVDGTNLERNLYLTTQLVELGIPMVVAVNMMDIVSKNGDKIDIKALENELKCKVVEISALKSDGIMEAAEAAIEAAKNKATIPQHSFAAPVEHALAHIEEVTVHGLPDEKQRWYAIKLFERDEKIQWQLGISAETISHIEADIAACEKEMDDDAESIITNERYLYIARIIDKVLKKNKENALSTSDKIDQVVTNRFLALPIFAAVMFLVYYISVTTVGTWVTDWTNDNLFGDGFHLFGAGAAAYGEAADEFGGAEEVVNAFMDNADENGRDTEALRVALDTEADGFDASVAEGALKDFASSYSDNDKVSYTVEDEETLEPEEKEATGADLKAASQVYVSYGFAAPDPAAYGTWIPGIPVVVENVLNSINCADWLKGLVLDGIVAGVGAV